MTNTTTVPRDRTSDFSDAVVAAYIHEISARHRPAGSGSRRSRRRGSERVHQPDPVVVAPRT
jgi:hypothetical protein